MRIVQPHLIGYGLGGLLVAVVLLVQYPHWSGEMAALQFYEAIDRADLDSITALAKKHPALIKDRPDGYYPPLHVAAYLGEVDVCKTLLNLGCKPKEDPPFITAGTGFNMRAVVDQSPFDAAFHGDSEEVMHLLLAHGALINGYYVHEIQFYITKGAYFPSLNSQYYIIAAIAESSLEKVTFLINSGAALSATGPGGVDILKYAQSIRDERMKVVSKGKGLQILRDNSQAIVSLLQEKLAASAPKPAAALPAPPPQKIPPAKAGKRVAKHNAAP